MKANKQSPPPPPNIRIIREGGINKEYDLIEVVKKIATLENFLKILNVLIIQFFFVRFIVVTKQECFDKNGLPCYYEDYILGHGISRITRHIGVMYFVFPLTGYISPYISIGRIKYFRFKILNT